MHGLNAVARGEAATDGAILLHRHSLPPDKIAEWMGHMIDPDNDRVQLVTVTNDEGEMLSWRHGDD